MSCPFKSLGLAPGASPAEVKIKWCELALKHHPDHGGSIEEFNALRAAYQAAYAAAVETPCPKCSGEGEIHIYEQFSRLSLPCPDCDGSGRKY